MAAVILAHHAHAAGAGAHAGEEKHMEHGLELNLSDFGIGHKASTEEDYDNPAPGSKLGGVPVHQRKAFHEASRLSIMDKLNADDLLAIELDECELLVSTLSQSEPRKGETENLDNKDKSTIMVATIRTFLMTQLDDPPSMEETTLLMNSFTANVGRKTAKTGEADIMITATQLHGAFTIGDGPVQFTKVRKIKRGLGVQVTRQFLTERLTQVTNRHDALMTLPITVAYVLLFIAIVTGHLRIYNRRLLENSMESYVNGRDPRETADENVDDLDSWFEWVGGAGTHGPLAGVKYMPAARGGYPYSLVASRNMLLGDVMLKMIKFDGTETKQWLLKTVAGAKALADAELLDPKPELRFRDAARAGAESLKESGWNDPQVEIVQLKFNTYNEYAKMFALCEVTIPLKNTGAVHHYINVDAVAADPYPERELLMTVDVAFSAIVLWIFFSELKDALMALRMGCGEFVDYLQFWNCVDWVNIILSVSTGVRWLACMFQMQADTILALVDNDYKVKVDLSTLSEPTLDAINEDLETLRDNYVAMQWVMAINTCSVVAKFFKAFSASPRLMVVTNTFRVAGVDLVHFFIIFSTIFLPFCVTGHVLFGNDLGEFASVVASLNTGFLLVMGEFAWYVDVSPTYFWEQFPSGMPKLVLTGWYWFFCFLILLVMLNMLLAIVIENYTATMEKMEKEVECPTIWRQVKEYMAFRKVTKKFKSLEDMLSELNFDANPAHPGEEVSKASLEEAFKMSPEQSEWTMKWLTDYLNLRSEKLAMTKTEELEELAEKNVEMVGFLAEAVASQRQKIDKIVSKATDEVQEKVVKADTDNQKLQGLFESVQGLVTGVGKMRKEQDRLTRRVQDLGTNVPKGGFPLLSAGGPQKVPDSLDVPKPPAVSDKSAPKSGRDRDRDKDRERSKDPARRSPRPDRA